MLECKNCRSCGAAIVFARTPSGKKMPCDVGCVYYAADPAGRESFVLDDGTTRQDSTRPSLALQRQPSEKCRKKKGGQSR